MKSATMYERGDKIYVHSSSKTTAGVWVINAPVLMVETQDIGGLGHSIKECLAASVEGVPHPKSFTNLFDPVLKLANVKSFNKFMQSAKCVEVELEDDIITLIPNRNEGAEDGFAPLPTKTQVADGTDEALGSAALSAFALAE